MRYALCLTLCLATTAAFAQGKPYGHSNVPTTKNPIPSRAIPPPKAQPAKQTAAPNVGKHKNKKGTHHKKGVVNKKGTFKL